MLKRVLFPAAAAAMLLSGPVFAQNGPGGFTTPVQGYQGPQTGNFGPGHGIQFRLQKLHDRLGITPAQQPQWDNLAGSIRQAAQVVRGSPAAQALRSGDLNAVQKLQAMADLAGLRAQAMQQVVPAAQALYAALSPQQRQTADAMLQRFGHHERHHHRHA